MFNTSKSNATQEPILQGIRVAQSLYNSPLILGYGTQRYSVNLLDYTDFQAIPVNSQTASGGKGFGGGSSKSTTMDYKAAVIMALCHGPVVGIHSVWDSRGALVVATAAETYVVPGGGGTIAVVNAGPNVLSDFGVARGDAYSVNINDYGDPLGPRTITGTQKMPMSAVVSGPAVGQYSTDGAGNYTFAAADAGKTVYITYSYYIPDSTGSGSPAQTLSVTLFTGELGQSPWPYMVSKHPGRALGYSGIAYLCASALDLGSSADLPNYTWELVTLFPFGAGIIDSNPKDCVTDWIGHPFRGANHPELLGDTTQFSNWCVANGLFLSPQLDQQQSLLQWLRELLDTTACDAIWSEGVLKLWAYGDTTIVGNGAVYTPVTSPVLDLTDDDFIVDSPGDEPVEIPRTSSAEVKNRVVVEWVNRANAYNAEPLVEDDKASIQQFGFRPDDSNARHMLCTLSAAQVSANLLLQREVYYRRQFKFKTDERKIFLEPLIDLVTLTDSGLGLNKIPVRLLECEEDADGNLQWVAEEFLFGTATPTLYGKQTGSGTPAAALADPGNVNAPIVFEAPDSISRSGNYEIWMGISGAGSNWGGASIRVSPDGTTYRRLDAQWGSSRTGTLQADFPVGSAHDVTNTLDVDLTESNGQLLSGTDADRDANRTLCWVGAPGGAWELISYKTATLVSGNRYHLTDINRGCYGTPIIDHPSGSRFLRVDDAITVLEFDALDVGTTAHFKLTSFNTYGLKEQSESVVTDYTYNVAGLFNNFAQIVSNNATVDAVGTPGGGPFTAYTVRGYGASTPGTDIDFGRSDGTSFSEAPPSFPGMALNTTYYLMFNPAAGSFYLLTDGNAVQTATYNGHIYINAVTTGNASGAGGTTGGSGGGGLGGFGGGSGCPAIEMHTEPGIQLEHTEPGYALDCLALPKRWSWLWRILQWITRKFPRRVFRERLRAKKRKNFIDSYLVDAGDGFQLVVAWNTWMTGPDGRAAWVMYWNGDWVACDRGPGTPVEWRRCVVTRIGPRDVFEIDAGNNTFACGVRGDRRIYSHNFRPKTT